MWSSFYRSLMLSMSNSTTIRVQHCKRTRVNLFQELPRPSSQLCIVVCRTQLFACMEPRVVTKHSRHRLSAAMLQNSRASDFVTSGLVLHHRPFRFRAQYHQLRKAMRDRTRINDTNTTTRDLRFLGVMRIMPWTTSNRWRLDKNREEQVLGGMTEYPSQ